MNKDVGMWRVSGASPSFTPMCTWSGCWVAVFLKLQSLAQRWPLSLRWKDPSTSDAEHKHLRAFLGLIGMNVTSCRGGLDAYHCQITAPLFYLCLLSFILSLISTQQRSLGCGVCSVSSNHKLIKPRILKLVRACPQFLLHTLFLASIYNVSSSAIMLRDNW